MHDSARIWDWKAGVRGLVVAALIAVGSGCGGDRHAVDSDAADVVDGLVDGPVDGPQPNIGFAHFDVGPYAVPYLPGRTFDPTAPFVRPPPGSGSVYYVDATSGEDTNSGESVTAAFKTIGRATPLLRAGDTLYILRGTYREGISLINQPSGTAQDPIVISAYGDGEVIVDASPEVTGWSLDAGSVYAATLGFVPDSVVADYRPLIPVPDRASVVAGTFYFDTGQNRLYLWTPSGADPSTVDLGVIETYDNSGPAMNGVYTYNTSYVNFYGLTQRFAAGNGFSVGTSRIENCKALFNGKAGILIGDGGEAVKNLNMFAVMINWPRGRFNPYGGWPGSVGSQGGNDVLLQGNISFKNGGEGIITYNGDTVVMRDNISQDSWSTNFYVDNKPNVTVDQNLALCSPPDLGEVYAQTVDMGESVKRLRSGGIYTADEEYGSGAHLRNVTISNNVIIGCPRAYGHYAHAAGAALIDYRFINNTLILPATTLAPICIGISLFADIPTTNVVFRDNLVYSSNPGCVPVWAVTDGASSPFPGVAMDHNLLFNAASDIVFRWWQSTPTSGGPVIDHTLQEYLAIPGTHGMGDVAADPQLGDASGASPLDLIPRPSSPAVGAGIDTGVLVDFFHAPRDSNAIDIGAITH